MTKFRRLMCFFLAIIMMFALTACGSDSGEKDEEAGGAGAKVENVKDIYDAFALASEYTKGDYKVEISFSADVDGFEGSGSINASGKIDGNDMTVNVSADVDADGERVKIASSDLLIVKGDKAYIDFDAILELAEINGSVGSVAFPLPKVDASAQKDYQKKVQDFSTGLLKAMFDGVSVSQSGNTYTVELKTAEEYLAAVNGMIDYISANKNTINDIYKSSYSSVDIQEYLNTLIDFYRDDIKSLVKQMYGEYADQITDEQIDQTIDQMKEQISNQLDLSEIEDELEDLDIFEYVDFDELKTAINSVSADELQEAIDEAGLSVKFSVTAEEDRYEVNSTMGMEYEGEKVEMSMKYTFEADSSVSIKAPSNVASLTDVYEFFMEYAGSLSF